MGDLGCQSSEIAAVPPCGRELLVAVANVTKCYGRTTAVAGVTLTLWAGEIWGFVGANGGGKTTTLRMLAGILRADGGHGHVLGFDLQRDAAKIRERVGYMSQRLSLYAELSVSENLRFRAAVHGLGRRALSGDRSHLPRTTGQQQRRGSQPHKCLPGHFFLHWRV